MNRAAAAIFLVGLCSACPKRIEFGSGGEVADPDALLALTAAAEAKIVTLQGDAKLRVVSPQGKGTVSLFVALSRPSLVHLETLDFFGKPLGVLVSNGERFGFYQAEENRFYQGPATPENISRFLPVALPQEELVAIMLGQAPRIPATAKALTLDRGEGAYRLTLTHGEVTQTLLIDPASHRVLRSQVTGVRSYNLRFDDFQTTGTVVFPRTAELMARSVETELEIRYTDVTLNAPPDLTLFEVAAPEGVPVTELDASGRELAPSR